MWKARFCLWRKINSQQNFQNDFPENVQNYIQFTYKRRAKLYPETFGKLLLRKYSCQHFIFAVVWPKSKGLLDLRSPALGGLLIFNPSSQSWMTLPFKRRWCALEVATCKGPSCVKVSWGIDKVFWKEGDYSFLEILWYQCIDIPALWLNTAVYSNILNCYGYLHASRINWIDGV